VLTEGKKVYNPAVHLIHPIKSPLLSPSTPLGPHPAFPIVILFPASPLLGPFLLKVVIFDFAAFFSTGRFATRRYVKISPRLDSIQWQEKETIPN
jgi:hypothetical protein